MEEFLTQPPGVVGLIQPGDVRDGEYDLLNIKIGRESVSVDQDNQRTIKLFHTHKMD